MYMKLALSPRLLNVCVCVCVCSSPCLLVLLAEAHQGDRFLKRDGRIIPAGGCQYATLVQMSDKVWSPPPWNGFNLSRLQDLQDTVYWKAGGGQKFCHLL